MLGTMKQGVDMPSLTLDLVMIVRDESRALARCLRSVRPWVDRMIVVDTGSSDQTVAIAQAEGAQVFHGPWGDDFAQARNHALTQSKADWCLMLDADEWLAEGGAALRASLTHDPFVGQVYVDNLFDVPGHTGPGSGHAISTDVLARLLPRGQQLHGCIHERPQPGLPTRVLPVRLGHDGYLDLHKQRKTARDLRLLLQALKANPDDAYLLYQWGKSQEATHAYAEAALTYAKADHGLGEVPHAAGGSLAPWRQDLLVRWLHCLSMAGQHEAAVILAGERCEWWCDATDFNFVVGTVMLNWAVHAPERAAELLPLAQASWESCLALGEQPERIGAVRGRGGALASWNLKVLQDGLAGFQASQARVAGVKSPPMLADIESCCGCVGDDGYACVHP